MKNRPTSEFEEIAQVDLRMGENKCNKNTYKLQTINSKLFA